MKKLKSIDFKALFVNHGEKFGLVVIVMIVLLALGRTSWSRYAGTPEDLDKKAKNARLKFTSLTGNPWPKEKAESFKVVDFNDRASQLFARLDLPRYEFTTPLSQPLYRKRELAREPEYLPVEYLIADPGRAILGISRAGSTTDSTIADSGTTVEATVPAGTGFRPSGPPGVAGGGITAPGTLAPGGVAGHAGASPMRSAPMANSGAAGAHGDTMHGGAMSGMGGTPSGVTARGVRYVAVRGVFPLQQQMAKYVSALKVMPAEASTMFELLDFVLERQAAVAGPNPWDTKWETVNVESALEVLREVSDFDLDPVKTGVTDSVITMSLPYRLLEFWGDHATHPNVSEFKLKPEEMERELKLQEKVVEEYEKAKLQSKPKYERRGLSGGQNDVRQMGQQMMASPSGAHGVPSMPSMPNSNMMSGLMGSMNDSGAGGPRMSQAEIKERLTANGRLLLFRYFDFDVQPGMAYRYRVKLVIRNPNFERAAAEVVDPALAEGAERETDWSNISMPAVVPTSINYFLKDVERDPSRDDKVRTTRPVANISMFEWKSELGTMVHDTLKILAIGQFISEKKKSIVVDVASSSYKVDEEVAFLTGDVLLDASGDFDIAPEQHPDLGLRTDKGRPSIKLGLLPEAIVMTDLGEMKELNPAAEKTTEQALKQRVDAERNEIKKMNDARTPTAGAAGGNAYDVTAGMSMSSAMGTPKASKKSPKKKGAGSGSSSGDSAGAHAAPDTGGKGKSKRSMP